MSGQLVGCVYTFGPRLRMPCHVLAVLAEQVGKDHDGVCWPSVPFIARKARLSERSVTRALGWLEEQGWIAVQHGRGMPGRKGRGRTSRYRLNLVKLRFSPSGRVLSGDRISPDRPSPDTRSPDRRSGDTVTSGKNCGNSVGSRGNPLKKTSPGDRISGEIHDNPPAPPIWKNRKKLPKATAEAGPASPARGDGDFWDGVRVGRPQ